MLTRPTQKRYAAVLHNNQSSHLHIYTLSSALAVLSCLATASQHPCRVTRSTTHVSHGQ